MIIWHVVKMLFISSCREKIKPVLGIVLIPFCMYNVWNNYQSFIGSVYFMIHMIFLAYWTSLYYDAKISVLIHYFVLRFFFGFAKKSLLSILCTLLVLGWLVQICMHTLPKEIIDSDYNLDSDEGLIYGIGYLIQ